MIKHIRIDNRLIHGQVAVSWMRSIGADKIIVCNDDVAADPIQKMALPMAAKNETVYVFSIAETLDYVGKHPDDDIFVICKYADDCLALLESGVEVKEVNVGNAAPRQGTAYTMVTKSIAVTPEEAKVYRQIAKLREGKLPMQLTTLNEPEDFLELLKKSGL